MHRTRRHLALVILDVLAPADRLAGELRPVARAAVVLGGDPADDLGERRRGVGDGVQRRGAAQARSRTSRRARAQPPRERAAAEARRVAGVSLSSRGRGRTGNS